MHDHSPGQGQRHALEECALHNITQGSLRNKAFAYQLL